MKNFTLFAILMGFVFVLLIMGDMQNDQHIAKLDAVEFLLDEQVDCIKVKYIDGYRTCVPNVVRYDSKDMYIFTAPGAEGLVDLISITPSGVVVFYSDNTRAIITK